MPTEDPMLKITDDLVEEVVWTAIAVDDVLTSLLSHLVEGAFPGKDAREELFRMMIGSIAFATRAAGEDACREATALVAAIRERLIADLHTAAELTTEHERRGAWGSLSVSPPARSFPRSATLSCQGRSPRSRLSRSLLNYW